MAVLGPLVVLALDLLLGARWVSGQGYALFVAALILVATGLVLIVFLRREARGMLRQPDILVPLGLYVLATGMLQWFSSLPVLGGILAPSWDLSLFSMSFSVSVSLLLGIALAVGFAAWTLGLICLATQGRAPDLFEGLRTMRRGGWRTLGYMTLAMLVFFPMMAVCLALLPYVMPLALISIGLGALLLNFATAGVLLRGIARPEAPFWPCLRDGIVVSCKNASRWWAPLLLQMEILGLFTVVHVSISRSFNLRRVTNWAVNGMWTGGFESDSRWLPNMMDAVAVPVPAVVTTLIGLVLGALAIAVKMRIARELHQVGELAATCGDSRRQ